MRTLGIDLSADPKKTGACLIDWQAFTVELLHRRITDEELVDAMAAADMTAIDVPLGWPDPFVDAVVAHRAGEPWPVAAVRTPEDRRLLRFRETDRFVQERGAMPLSVSTDRIGVAAMRGARLQHLLRSVGVEIDRSGMSGRICEAYPAGALRVWGLESSRYKGAKSVEARGRLSVAVVGQCGPLAAAAERVLESCNDDDLDAFICALVARAVHLGATHPPAVDQDALARREGWIHLPNTALAELVSLRA